MLSSLVRRLRRALYDVLGEACLVHVSVPSNFSLYRGRRSEGSPEKVLCLEDGSRSIMALADLVRPQSAMISYSQRSQRVSSSEGACGEHQPHRHVLNFPHPQDKKLNVFLGRGKAQVITRSHFTASDACYQRRSLVSPKYTQL